MKHFFVDFSGCKYISQLHGILKATLELPDFYGENLSVLWDCLTGHMETPAVIYIKGMSTLPEELQREANAICETRAETMYGDVSLQIE